jgi:hypothetical protein
MINSSPGLPPRKVRVHLKSSPKRLGTSLPWSPRSVRAGHNPSSFSLCNSEAHSSSYKLTSFKGFTLRRLTGAEDFPHAPAYMMRNNGRSGNSVSRSACPPSALANSVSLHKFDSHYYYYYYAIFISLVVLALTYCHNITHSGLCAFSIIAYLLFQSVLQCIRFYARFARYLRCFCGLLFFRSSSRPSAPGCSGNLYKPLSMHLRLPLVIAFSLASCTQSFSHTLVPSAPALNVTSFPNFSYHKNPGFDFVSGTDSRGPCGALCAGVFCAVLYFKHHSCDCRD